MTKVLEEEEEEEESSKEGSEKLSRTESSKSFESFGEEVLSIIYVLIFVKTFHFHLLQMSRGSRKISKKKSACSTLSNSSDQV